MAIIDRVCFVRWYDVVSQEAIDEVLRAIEAAPTGKPRYYCSLSDENIPPPTLERQKLMVPFAIALLRSVSEIHIIFEGAGMRHAVTRMSMRTLVNTARRARSLFGVEIADAAKHVFLHVGVSQFLQQVRHELRASEAEILRALAAEGLL